MASEGAVANHTWTDAPLGVRTLTIDGNAAGNRQGVTVGLALRSWFSSVDDVKVQNTMGDGILLSSSSPSKSDGPNGRITNSWISNVGGHGLHVDGDTTDWNFESNWISDTGGSALNLFSAAGWQIRNVSQTPQ